MFSFSSSLQRNPQTALLWALSMLQRNVNSSNALLERCIKMNKIKYRFKLLTKLVWKVIKILCVYELKICEDIKSKQGQLLSILTKIRYSHGQQSLLVGKCLRENHRQIKSCLPHLPANHKKSGDFAESRKQVTSSCFK